MTATAFVNGHEVNFNKNSNKWVYIDTKESIDIARPCRRCGNMPTEEGYGGCIGELSGVKYACCGHGGANKPYVILDSGKHVEFKNIEEMKKYQNG